MIEETFRSSVDLAYSSNNLEKDMYEEGDTITISMDVWCHFLSHHEHLLVSLWDMIPPNLIIKEIEWIPFSNGPLYLFEYAGIQFYLYEHELIPLEEEDAQDIYRE